MCQLKLHSVMKLRTGESRRCRVNNEAKAFGDAHTHSCARHEKTLGPPSREAQAREWGAVLVFVFVHATRPPTEQLKLKAVLMMTRARCTHCAIPHHQLAFNHIVRPFACRCGARGSTRSCAGRFRAWNSSGCRGLRSQLCPPYGRHCFYLAEPKCSK